MNNEIPEPIPHLELISSINITIIPPRNNWNTKINCNFVLASPINAADGANPPNKTKMNDSTIINDIAIIFCNPSNFFFPSGVVKSILMIPAPFNNCNIIDPVTIGPIPNERRLPNEAPKIIDKYSNCCRPFSPKPKSGTFPKAKKKTRIIIVHFIFSLNGNLFWLH